jgi:hypothetical protein
VDCIQLLPQPAPGAAERAARAAVNRRRHLARQRRLAETHAPPPAPQSPPQSASVSSEVQEALARARALLAARDA